MEPENVISQRDWTDEELRDAGYQYFERRKYLVLARPLPDSEAPLHIQVTSDEVLIATTGYIICYRAGVIKRKSLYDYHHWPVAPDHFADMYRDWDDPNWRPWKWGEKHLVELGCKPYYNAAGVWAKKVTEPTWIYGAEHDHAHVVPVGGILILGAVGSTRGAPWWSSEKAFAGRFVTDKSF